MGIHKIASTIDFATLICSECGGSTQYDISEEEYRLDKYKYDNWCCIDCTLSAENRTFVISGTGHRPDKVKGPHERLVKLAEAALKKYQPTQVIAGMALGWDTALAEAAVNLGIPMVAAVPFRGQEILWSKEQQHHYNWLLSEAYYVAVLKEHPGVNQRGLIARYLQERNEYLVDNSHFMLALWDGSQGGTSNCLSYISQKGLKVGKHWTNLWKSWLKYR